MITVSSEQLDALRSPRVDKFCAKLVHRQRARHSEKCKPYSDEELATKLRDEMLYADDNGFTAKSVLERYADLSLAVGFGFGKSEPWATEIIRSSGEEHGKMNQLERAAVFVIRERE